VYAAHKISTHRCLKHLLVQVACGSVLSELLTSQYFNLYSVYHHKCQWSVATNVGLSTTQHLVVRCYQLRNDQEPWQQPGYVDPQRVFLTFTYVLFVGHLALYTGYQVCALL